MEKSEERLRTIGEVARISGVPVKTIRYYADIGLLPPAEVSASRYRLYGTEEVWRLGLIRALRRLDFSIEEVRAVVSGNLSVSDAIAFHLDALENRLRHLERVRAILRQAAKDAADPERSLEHLRDIGAALAVEARDRERFLAEKLRAAVVTEDAPEEWRDRDGYLRGLGLRLPEELSPEQAAAWIEVVKLVKDPEFVADMRGQTASFWNTVRGRGVDPDRWQERMEDISDRALAAIERGEGPESPAAQEIVADWAALLASVMGEEPTSGFLRRLAALVPAWVENDRNRKLQELLTRLDPEGDPPPYEQVNRLLLEGLRRRVAQEPEPPKPGS